MSVTRITIPIMRLLHARPYLSAPEVARALGFRRNVCGTALDRLLAAGDLIARFEGREIEMPNGSKLVRRLRCYAIAPVDLKDLPMPVDVPGTREKVLDFLKFCGGGFSCKEIAKELGLKVPAVARVLQILIAEGRLVREEDERTVIGKKGQRQHRTQIYVYSLAEGSS